MPMFEGKLITPDDAMAKGLCPECAADLTKVNPIGHMNTHWSRPPKIGRRGDEARRRIAMFQDFIQRNKVRTSNMPKPVDKPAAATTKKHNGQAKG